MWSEDYGSSFSSKNPLPRGIDRDPSAPLGNVQLSQITINALFTLINLKSGAMDFFFNGQQKENHTRCLVWQLRGFTDAALIRAFFFHFLFPLFHSASDRENNRQQPNKSSLSGAANKKKKKRSSPGRNNWLLYVDDNPLAHCRSLARTHTHAYTTNTNRFSLYLTLASMCCRLIKAR